MSTHPKLDKRTRNRIRKLYNSGPPAWSTKELADKYGVSTQTIRRIIHTTEEDWK